MSTENTSSSQQDAACINVQGIYERQAWAKVFNVSRDELMLAVKAVGNKADDVAHYLTARLKRPVMS